MGVNGFGGSAPRAYGLSASVFWVWRFLVENEDAPVEQIRRDDRDYGIQNENQQLSHSAVGLFPKKALPQPNTVCLAKPLRLPDDEEEEEQVWRERRMQVQESLLVLIHLQKVKLNWKLKSLLH